MNTVTLNRLAVVCQASNREELLAELESRGPIQITEVNEESCIELAGFVDWGWAFRTLPFYAKDPFSNDLDRLSEAFRSGMAQVSVRFEAEVAAAIPPDDAGPDTHRGAAIAVHAAGQRAILAQDAIKRELEKGVAVLFAKAWAFKPVTH